MDAEVQRKELERGILAIIEEKLKNGQIDATRAKEIARLVLDKLHPPLTLEQIYAVAPTLDDHFSELTTAILPLMKGHQDQIKEVVTSHAAELIASGKIKEAHVILKQATTPIK